MQKKIMLVGEAYGVEEERHGKPFVGTSGYVLDGILRQVGINRAECHITNVFNFRPPSNKLDNLFTDKTNAIPLYRPIKPGKYIHRRYQSELDRLFAEIERVQPNIIVALGNTPLWALCKKVGIKKYRGSPLLTHDGRWKVLPTWHPAAVSRQWELRVISLADFYKAKRESEFPELNRPKHLIYMEPDLDDIEAFYNQFLRGQPFLSCDIETKERTITEVGYATADGSRCIVIPFWSRRAYDGNYWPDHKSERKAWDWVRRINAEFPLIGQNFSYDMQYFWRTVGIPCPRFLGDTMILHHALQPEMEKGLGFLGSIYTNEPSWKFMRQDHSTLKLMDD